MSDWQPGFYQRIHGPFPPPIGGLQNGCRIEFKECEPGEAVRALYVSFGCDPDARFFEVNGFESVPEGDLIAICEHEILTD